MKWISIDEKLPQQGDAVLCTDTFHRWVSVFFSDKKFFSLPNETVNILNPYYQPTHWMELPAMPERSDITKVHKKLYRRSKQFIQEEAQA